MTNTTSEPTGMGKYIMGVDMATGEDYSCYVVARRLRWYDKLLRKLKLSKATWTFKIVDTWQEPPTPKESKGIKS